MPIGSIIGGLIGSQGAQAAGSAAGAAGEQAYQNARGEINTDRSSLTPWTQSGIAAQNKLNALLGLGTIYSGDGSGWYGIDSTGAKALQTKAYNDFQTTPGYQFRLDQGVKALDRSAASKGMLLSGAQTKGLNDYAQGQASSEYGNYVNQLKGVSDSGLAGQTGVNNTAAGVFTNGNNALMNGNLARANSYQNSANALASGIASGIQNGASLASFGLGSGWFGGGGGVSPAGAPAGGYTINNLANSGLPNALGGLQQY